MNKEESHSNIEAKDITDIVETEIDVNLPEIENMSIDNFEQKDLPTLIQGQMSKLSDIDKSISKALKASDTAMESAESAKNKSVSFGRKKAAIEELQGAVTDIAEAMQDGTQAQKMSFEFQTELAEITKYLFTLGVSDIARNRYVVRELELRLKGASEEKLSELAQKEISLVVKQLKEQEEVLTKQNNISKELDKHDEQFDSYGEKHKELEQKIDELKEKDSNLALDIEKNLEVTKAQGEELKEYREKISELETELSYRASDKVLKITLVLVIIALILCIVNLVLFIV